MADRRLQVFHAVARHRSFTKAAESLFMTQPAVTFQIKQLEEQYNARLFERGHGRVSLTPAGEMVLDYAERILALSGELDARLRDMTDSLAGPLLVGASMTVGEFILPAPLAEFSQRHPEVRPRLEVGNSESIENRVADHTLDLGLIESPSQLPALVSEPVCEDELQVVVSPRHALAREATLAPARLVGESFISRESGAGTREFTEIYLRQAGIAPGKLPAAMELGSPEAVKGVLASGRGFSIMSARAIDKERRLGELVAIPLSPPLQRTLSLVYPRDKFRTRLTGAFIEFIRERLGPASAVPPPA